MMQAVQGEGVMTFGRKTLMLLLGLCLEAVAPAKAAGNDLTLCLDTTTRLDAGGDVSDKELAAAQAACARVAAAQPGHEESVKITAAFATLGDEHQRRAHH